MTEETLRVKSLTGVEMTLPIAGPGTRSYAFLTDWMIRLLGALVWLLLAVLLRLAPGIAGRPVAHTVLVAGIILALVTYFLYEPVLEILTKGCTPGLRTAEARIVTLDGMTPGLRALIIRNVFRLIDCLPAFYVVGMITCMLTPRRVRLGDIAAGTVIVRTDAHASGSLDRLAARSRTTRLSVEALALVHELLERWDALEEAARARLARALLTKLDAAPADHGSEADTAALRAHLEALLVDEPRIGR
jgi:uncharacterized RDD family membrane protein YckC